MLRAQEEAKALFEGFRTPFLIIHGTGDKICLIDGSRAMYEACPSEDKTLKVGSIGAVQHWCNGFMVLQYNCFKLIIPCM